MFRYFCINFLHRRRRDFSVLFLSTCFSDRDICCYILLLMLLIKILLLWLFIFLFLYIYIFFVSFLVLTLINCKFIFMLLNIISYTSNPPACYLFIRFSNTQIFMSFIYKYNFLTFLFLFLCEFFFFLKCRRK